MVCWASSGLESDQSYPSNFHFFPLEMFLCFAFFSAIAAVSIFEFDFFNKNQLAVYKIFDKNLLPPYITSRRRPPPGITSRPQPPLGIVSRPRSPLGIASRPRPPLGYTSRPGCLWALRAAPVASWHYEPPRSPLGITSRPGRLRALRTTPGCLWALRATPGRL